MEATTQKNKKAPLTAKEIQKIKAQQEKWYAAARRRLEARGEAEAYDAWVRQKVQEALDEANKGGPFFTSEEMEAEAAAWRAETYREMAKTWMATGGAGLNTYAKTQARAHADNGFLADEADAEDAAELEEELQEFTAEALKVAAEMGLNAPGEVEAYEAWLQRMAADAFDFLMYGEMETKEETEAVSGCVKAQQRRAADEAHLGPCSGG